MSRRSPAWHPQAASICSKCGALVSKKRKHKKWHKKTERLDWTGPMGPQGPAGPMGMAGRDAVMPTDQGHAAPSLTREEFDRVLAGGTDEDKDKLYQHMAANEKDS